MSRRHSSRSAENVSRAQPPAVPPPPDIVSDLNITSQARTEARTEVNTEVQSCIDFIDCLLRTPDMVEIPRDGRSASSLVRTMNQQRGEVEAIAANLPLKQQRETLLC